jgi:hypothetical protein
LFQRLAPPGLRAPRKRGRRGVASDFHLLASHWNLNKYHEIWKSFPKPSGGLPKLSEAFQKFSGWATQGDGPRIAAMA